MLHMFLFNCQRFASKQVHQNIIRMLLLCSFLQTFTNWPMLVCQLSLSSCGVWWHSSKREKILGWDYRCNIHLWLNFTNKWIGFDDKICKHYSRTKGQQAIKHHSIVQKISLPLPQWVSPFPSGNSSFGLYFHSNIYRSRLAISNSSPCGRYGYFLKHICEHYLFR